MSDHRRCAGCLRVFEIADLANGLCDHCRTGRKIQLLVFDRSRVSHLSVAEDSEDSDFDIEEQRESWDDYLASREDGLL